MLALEVLQHSGNLMEIKCYPSIQSGIIVSTNSAKSIILMVPAIVNVEMIRCYMLNLLHSFSLEIYLFK